MSYFVERGRTLDSRRHNPVTFWINETNRPRPADRPPTQCRATVHKWPSSTVDIQPRRRRLTITEILPDVVGEFVPEDEIRQRHSRHRWTNTTPV